MKITELREISASPFKLDNFGIPRKTYSKGKNVQIWETKKE